MSAEPVIVTHAQMFEAILQVTGWVIPATPAGEIGALAKALLAAGVFPADLVYRFGAEPPPEGWWWWRDDFRGRQGDAPSNKALRTLAPRYCGGGTVQPPAPVAVREPAGFAALRQLRERRQMREAGR